MIMVDELKVYPNAWGPFRQGSCHLSTDGPIDELHAFAAKLGMQREWFQQHPSLPHYDLTPKKHELALKLGAVFVPARTQAQQRLEARRARYGDKPVADAAAAERQRAAQLELEWREARAVLLPSGAIVTKLEANTEAFRARAYEWAASANLTQEG